MDNNYRITFVGKGAVETLILDFTDKDIELFDVYFQSKFAYDKQSFLAEIDSDLIKMAAFVEFYANSDNFTKVSDVLSELNKQMDAIDEVIIYKNDELYCDLKNIINISVQNSIRDKFFTLSIIEGVQ